MDNLIGWLAGGAIIGWLASRVTRNYALQGLVLNIVGGVVGAFLAGRVLAPLLGLAAIHPNDFSLPATSTVAELQCILMNSGLWETRMNALSLRFSNSSTLHFSWNRLSPTSITSSTR